MAVRCANHYTEEAVKKLYYLYKILGAKGNWDFWISDLVKTLMELIFNPCVEFQ